MKFLGYDSAFMRFFIRLFRITIANLLWLLGCLPVVTVGASTAGLYVAMDRLRLDDQDVFGNYRRGFKTHWKKATIGWLIVAAFAAVLIYEYHLYKMEFFKGHTVLTVILIIAVVTLTFVALWFFPILINFVGSFGDIAGNAFIFAFMYAPLTLVSVALYAGLFYLIFRIPYLMWIAFLFGNALIVYISLGIYEFGLRKYRKRPEDSKE